MFVLDPKSVIMSMILVDIIIFLIIPEIVLSFEMAIFLLL